MKILGVDYGRSKIGLSLADTTLAEPYKVIKVSSPEEAIKKIGEVVEVEKIEKVVVGISEGEMAEETKNFSLSLGRRLNIPIENYDETLSTQEAQSKSILSGISRKKRREMEDAYAASIMLQNYLDFQA